MPRKKKEQPIGIGLSTRQMRRKRRQHPLVGYDYLIDIQPQTENQKLFFDLYRKEKCLIAHGCAGTGKSFIALYNALKDVLSDKTPYEKIYIVRSLVPSRDIGFLPGNHDDKAELYEIPYKRMVNDMFDLQSDIDYQMLYGNLKSQETIRFWSTSFVRGVTFDNAIVIVDEFQNLNFHELDSIITRIGEDSKIIFCGDATQSDLIKTNERNGIHNFMKILETMSSTKTIEFGVDDIVRSQFLKEYIIAKLELGM